MAQTLSIELAGISSLPAVKPSAPAAYGARLRRYRASFVLASQVLGAGNELVLAKIPAGHVFAFGVITTDTSLATSTVAIGNATTSGKYRTAAVFTATDTPTLFGNTTAIRGSAQDDPALPVSLNEETVLALVAVANLPAAGNLVIDLYFTNG